MRRLPSSSNIVQQVLELRQFAEKQFKQNLQKYNKLKESGAVLSFTICIPTIAKRTDLKPKEFNSEKLYLEGMVNNLIKDEQLLTKAQRKHIYEMESEAQEKKDTNESIYKSYNYLRKAWTQFIRASNQPVDDHLDRLNKTVAVIKGNLQKSLTSIKNQKVRFPRAEELLTCSQYQRLMLDYERTHMILEDTVQRYENRLLGLQRRNKKLEQQTVQLKKELQQLKARQSASNPSALTPAPRPSILTPNLQFKPLFQNSYYQLRLMKIPADDTVNYAKCIEDLKAFVRNYNSSQEQIKEQKALSIRNLHQFARSQDITKVRFQKTKMNALDKQKMSPAKFYTKLEHLRPEITKLM